MKQITTNKILVIIWILVLGPLIFFHVSKEEIPAWERILFVIFWVVTALLNVYRAVRDNIDLSLVGEILIVRRIFSKEQQYNLSLVVKWSEYEYKLLGFTTARTITLTIKNEKRINLFDNDSNSSEFKKVSIYLNSNCSHLGEN